MALYDRDPSTRFRRVLEAALEARNRLRKKVRENPESSALKSALVVLDAQVQVHLDRGARFRTN